MEDERIEEIFKLLQGITYSEWDRVKTTVNRYFENETSKQAKQISIGSPEDIMKLYKYHFL